MNPLISVIVPVYNKEKYLHECIDSILNQNFKDFELIIVDDGSSDSSWSIISEYASKDNRVIPISQENTGVSAARNAGLDKAHGKWICFVDADDYLPHNGFGTLIEHAEKRNADIINANAIRIDGNKRRRVFKFTNKIVKGDVLPSLVHFAPWAQLFKKNIIDTHHLRYIKGLAYSEDNVFITHYALFAHSVEFVDDVVYYYRINPDSVIQNKKYVEIAFHQFWAAHEVYKLQGINRDNSKTIIKRTKALLTAGVNTYMHRAIDIIRTKTMLSVYYTRFNDYNHFTLYILKKTVMRFIKLILKQQW